MDRGTGSSESRLPFVQGLRGLSVLLVVAFHAGLGAPAGYVGVDVFFVISGFVITAMLLREGRESGQVSLTRFYARRVRRLLPALAVMLSATMVLSALLQSPFGAQQTAAKAGLGASASVGNVVLYTLSLGYFGAEPSSIPLLHTWSLGVEEQFYAVFPGVIALALLATRRRASLRQASVVATLGCIAVASVAMCAVLRYRDFGRIESESALAFFFAPTRAWEFCIGGIIAGIGAQPLTRLRALGGVTAAAGLALIVGTGLLRDETLSFPSVTVLTATVGAALLIAGGLAAPSTPVARLMSLRPLTVLGDLSYSWYLWHWPFIVFAVLVWDDSAGVKAAAAAASLLVAFAAYRFVESPIRYRTITRRYDAVKLAAVCVVVPAVLAVGLLAVANRHWFDSSVERLAVQGGYDGWAGNRKHCFDTLPLNARALAPCTYGGRGGAPIYLLGDSNSLMYAEGLSLAGEQLGRPVIVAAALRCVLADIRVTGSLNDWSHCDRYVRESVEYLERQPSGTIVLANANTVIGQEHAVITDLATGERARTREQKTDAWARGLARTMSRLQRAGHDVILVNAAPNVKDGHGFKLRDDCSLLRLKTSGCISEVSLRDADAAQAQELEAEHTAARAANVAELNLRRAICPQGSCVTQRGDRLIIADGHITLPVSRGLAPRFRAALSR